MPHYTVATSNQWNNFNNVHAEANNDLGRMCFDWNFCWILWVRPRVMKSEEKHKLGDINVDNHGPFWVNAIDLKQDYQESSATKVTATEFEQSFSANHKVIL